MQEIIFHYVIKGKILAQNCKFSNKNNFIPVWKDFKSIVHIALAFYLAQSFESI